MDALFGRTVLFKAYKELIENAFIFKSTNTNSHSIRASGMNKHQEPVDFVQCSDIERPYRSIAHCGTLNILSSSSTVIESWPTHTLILLEFVGQFCTQYTYIVVRLLIAFYDAVHNLSVHVCFVCVVPLSPFSPYHKTNVFLFEPMQNQLTNANSKRMVSVQKFDQLFKYVCNAWNGRKGWGRGMLVEKSTMFISH